MIRLTNLTAGYDRRPAVHHLSGTFAEGTLTAVVGPNGGGKSTLLKIIAGFLRPLSGSLQAPHRQHIAYLPQTCEIDKSFPITVFDTVMLGASRTLGMLRGASPAQREQCLHALEAVGMVAFASRPIGALSSGQLQRVLFARLMLMEADVLLLDEPFSAIDTRTTADLLQLMQAWHKAGKTIITVLHDMHQAAAYFPESLMLAREKIAWGATRDVLCEENLHKARLMAEHWHETAEACAL